MPIARGSVLGFLIGIIPGSAHIISSFMSYALERRSRRHPEEFGKGAVAGVAGPESANNAASTGAFVPMLALGIPTGPVTAVLMAALLIHGVPPGPTLVNDHPNVFWGFVASMYVGNLMLLALNLPLVGLFVNLLRIPYAYLYPLIIMFCVIGVYEVNHSIVDVWIMLIMGVVGYGLKKFGFDPAPLVLGLVIAPIFEMWLRQSLIMSNGTWAIFLRAADRAGAAGAERAACWRSPRSRRCSTRDWRGKLAEAEAEKRMAAEEVARQRSRPQPLFLQALVQVGDVFAVAVEQQRRLALVGADDLLGRLAPARMRDLRIDVGPEAVFGRLQRLPVALRPLVGEGEAHDRLDRLEAVLPRRREPHRRAHLLRHRLAVGAGDHEGELVGRLRHGQPFDIGPRIPALALRRAPSTGR